MVNTFHCQVTDGGATDQDRDDIITAVNALVPLAVQNYISAPVVLSQVRIYNLPAVKGPLGDPAYVVATNIHGQGDQATELPPQCAITVSWLDAQRRHWGRIYLGGFCSNAAAAGRIADACAVAISSAAKAFATDLQNAGCPLVVWNRNSWTSLPVHELQVDDVWDVQRRRRFGVALNRHHQTI